MRWRSGASQSERCAVGSGRRWLSDDLAEKTKRCAVGWHIPLGWNSRPLTIQVEKLGLWEKPSISSLKVDSPVSDDGDSWEKPSISSLKVDSPVSDDRDSAT